MGWEFTTLATAGPGNGAVLFSPGTEGIRILITPPVWVGYTPGPVGRISTVGQWWYTYDAGGVVATLPPDGTYCSGDPEIYYWGEFGVPYQWRWVGETVWRDAVNGPLGLQIISDVFWQASNWIGTDDPSKCDPGGWAFLDLLDHEAAMEILGSGTGYYQANQLTQLEVLDPNVPIGATGIAWHVYEGASVQFASGNLVE